MKYKSPAVSIGLSRNMMRKLRRKGSTKEGLTQLPTQQRKQKREVLGLSGKKKRSNQLSTNVWFSILDHNILFSFDKHTVAWVLPSGISDYLGGQFISPNFSGLWKSNSIVHAPWTSINTEFFFLLGTSDYINIFKRREDRKLPEYATKIRITSLLLQRKNCSITGNPGYPIVMDWIVFLTPAPPCDCLWS